MTTTALTHKQTEVARIKQSMELYRQTSEELLENMTGDRTQMRGDVAAKLSLLESDLSSALVEKSRLEADTHQLRGKVSFPADDLY